MSVLRRQSHVYLFICTHKPTSFIVTWEPVKSTSSHRVTNCIRSLRVVTIGPTLMTKCARMIYYYVSDYATIMLTFADVYVRDYKIMNTIPITIK